MVDMFQRDTVHMVQYYPKIFENAQLDILNIGNYRVNMYTHPDIAHKMSGQKTQQVLEDILNIRWESCLFLQTQTDTRNTVVFVNWG